MRLFVPSELAIFLLTTMWPQHAFRFSESSRNHCAASSEHAKGHDRVDKYAKLDGRLVISGTGSNLPLGAAQARNRLPTASRTTLAPVPRVGSKRDSRG